MPKLNLPCQLSQEGLHALPTRTKGERMQQKGIVVRETRDKSCYAVLWEGHKSLEVYHKDFIEIIKQEDNHE